MSRAPRRPPGLELALLILAGTSLRAEVPRKVLAVDGKCPHRYKLKNAEECAPAELCMDHTLPKMDGSCPEDIPEVTKTSCKTSFRPDPEAATRPRAGCGAESNAPRRRLFVSNGRLTDVLAKYLEEARRHNIDVPLETLTIHYFDASNQHKTLSLPQKPRWAAIFSDNTPARRWDKLVAAEVAMTRPDPAADAGTLEADLVCGD